MIEEDRDLMVVAEVTGGRESAEVDRVEVLDVGQVHDQTQGPRVPDDPDQCAAQPDGVRGVEDAVRVETRVPSGVV
ncbi:hypothetical protein [Micromonospora chersina]|uniref:hypothetical protein n=1 Tax=Micromonospora chersina TaxID=47854 RepID=UPI0033B92EF0